MREGGSQGRPDQEPGYFVLFARTCLGARTVGQSSPFMTMNLGILNVGESTSWDSKILRALSSFICSRLLSGSPKALVSVSAAMGDVILPIKGLLFTTNSNSQLTKNKAHLLPVIRRFLLFLNLKLSQSLPPFLSIFLSFLCSGPSCLSQHSGCLFPRLRESMWSWQSWGLCVGSGSVGDLISPFTSRDIFTSFIFLWEQGGRALREVRSVRLYEVNFSCEVWCQLLDLVNFEQQVMSVRLPVQVQYRNGTYFGVFQNYQRSGHGVLVLDNSQILLAQWKKNTVHGKYVFISDQLRAYGTMLQGRLDGYNIIATTPNGQNAQTQTLYGMFREDRLYGKAVSVSGGQVTVGQFASSELKEVISRSSIKNSEVYEALTQHFPKNMYTLQEFLIAFMREAGSAIQDEEEVPRYMPVVLAVGEDRFFGYEECFNKGRRYGFILKENKVLSVGEHNGNLLQGIGRFYADDVIEDGIFKEGHLRGIGIKFYYQGNKYTLGQHDGKSSLERGFGFPTREVCEIRKQFHLRSIYFYNDIVMLGLTAHFTGLLSSLALDGKTKRESPKFTEDRRQSNSSALYKYEVDQDIVEDSSPIKDKFSEYKPVDRKTNKYFTLDQEEEEYDRRKQKDRSLNKMGNYRDIKNEPSNTRFTEQGNSRGRVGAVESRDRSATRGGRSGVKDTREFVRQLEEEEKRKRLDLDKIYRQAGLYKKR